MSKNGSRRKIKEKKSSKMRKVRKTYWSGPTKGIHSASLLHSNTWGWMHC